MERRARHQKDGAADGLIPLESLSLDRVTTFTDLLRAMGKTAFGGRALGEAFEVTLAMVRDPECRVVLTLSGAMTIAKMGGVVATMIDSGMVQAVVSTGALVAHGLAEAIGNTHYRHDPRWSDQELFLRGYNRVYDTLELESNLDHVEDFTRRALATLDETQELCSSDVCRAIGKLLSESDSVGILCNAYRKDVPVSIPAFTDSELGLDLSVWAMRRAPVTGAEGPGRWLDSRPRFNPYLDLNRFARQAIEAKRLGIFTIGGGVPRNWAQEVGPYVDVVNERLRAGIKPVRYAYGVRICPEPVHWGGLSGCSYAEGVSWGKFVPKAEGGRFAEVHADATTVWPLLIKGVLEELGRDREEDPAR